MSIVLKGIDLPTKYDAPLMVLIYSNGDATATTKEMSGYNKAKTIQISKDHGRIIDEKELKTKIHDVTLEGGALHGCIDKTVLHEVSAILEAEEG